MGLGQGYRGIACQGLQRERGLTSPAGELKRLGGDKSSLNTLTLYPTPGERRSERTPTRAGSA